jgi:exo-beta-1,3-glucanase (GH17 family)
VARDLGILAQFTSHLRVYSLTACSSSTIQILEYAKTHNMRVFLGLWVGTSTSSNEQVGLDAQQILLLAELSF